MITPFTIKAKNIPGLNLSEIPEWATDREGRTKADFVRLVLMMSHEVRNLNKPISYFNGPQLALLWLRWIHYVYDFWDELGRDYYYTVSDTMLSLVGGVYMNPTWFSDRLVDKAVWVDGDLVPMEEEVITPTIGEGLTLEPIWEDGILVAYTDVETGEVIASAWAPKSNTGLIIAGLGILTLAVLLTTRKKKNVG